MTTTHAQRKALGDFGERLAARRLVEAGYAILDRNWRCRDGEIDIVASDGSQLVVCEVKTRSSLAYGTALEAVDSAKSARLHRLGRRWLETHPDAGLRGAVRVDVVTVLRARRGPAVVEHIAGVF